MPEVGGGTIIAYSAHRSFGEGGNEWIFTVCRGGVICGYL